MLTVCAGLSIEVRNPPLTVSVFAIMAVDGMNVADLQSANAGNVKKISNWLISQTLTEHTYRLCRLIF